MRGIFFAVLAGAFLTFQGAANARISQGIGTWQAATLTQFTGSNIASIRQIGVTLTVSALLIAQLSTVFLIDSNGWFGVTKQRMGLPQFLGIALMIAGVVILGG